MAISSVTKPRSIIYLDLAPNCKSEGDVAAAILDAIGWYSDPLIDPSKPPSVREAVQYFFRAAHRFRSDYKRIPVFIIDNANRLALYHPDILDLLQDYAKLAVDQGTATIVFVSSEGRVPRQMMQRSAWSRQGRICHVGDVKKEEALLYLQSQGIREEVAAEIYDLVGGRMVHLGYASSEKGNSSEVRRKLFFDAESRNRRWHGIIQRKTLYSLDT